MSKKDYVLNSNYSSIGRQRLNRAKYSKYNAIEVGIDAYWASQRLNCDERSKSSSL